MHAGYAQMASLVCGWLKLTDDKGSHDTSAGPSTSASAASLDEVHFLKEFAKQKFDSEKLAKVFSANSGKPPAWIEQLTQDPRGVCYFHHG